jgi:hypothetical protein
MSETLGISKAILNLNDINDKFQLAQTAEPQFFTEWFEDLPEIDEREKASLNKLKNRYLYYAADGAITEGTINLIIISPLLEIMNLFDPPFKVLGERSVKVELEDEGKQEDPLEGRIDALIVRDRFWLVVIEAKRYGFDPILAVPQTLAYMMANPNRSPPIFGMATSGNDYVFIKLNRQSRQYALSKKFVLSNPQSNELYDVLRIMKRITGLLAEQ